MINFKSDYLEGAYPEILEKLVETNFEQTSGYGDDYHTENAKALIKKACEREDIDVHFLVGGTQTNTTVIASVLRPFEGVICADTGHINCHETGAIEATGHKVMALPSDNGKITAEQIESYFVSCNTDPCYEHIVQPGMVYISNTTETNEFFQRFAKLKIHGKPWEVQAVDRMTTEGILGVYLKEDYSNDFEEEIVPEVKEDVVIEEPITFNMRRAQPVAAILGPNEVHPFDICDYTINISGGAWLLSNEKARISTQTESSVEIEIITGRSGQVDLVYKTETDEIVYPITILSM